MFKGFFFLLLVFLIRASFSKNDEKHVSKININYIKLVSMCSLGTVLWLTLKPAGHLCSFNKVTVEIDLCATCHIFALPSFAGQNSSISTSSLLSQLF